MYVNLFSFEEKKINSFTSDNNMAIMTKNNM